MGAAACSQTHGSTAETAHPSHAQHGVVTTHTPSVWRAPTPDTHQPERVAALHDLDPVWVRRTELANLYDGARLLVLARVEGGLPAGPPSPRTHANTHPVIITLGNRAGSQGVDADHDGVSDAAERAIHTDPANADTDGDTIPDGFELFGLQTLPWVADSDADGVADNVELDLDAPATYGDDDGDGLSNSQETARLGSDPHAIDSDGDGFGDDVEFFVATHVNDRGHPDADADGDGELDAYESANGLDPHNPASMDVDTHGDHIPDWLHPDAAATARVRGRSAAVPAAPCTPPQDNHWGKSEG